MALEISTISGNPAHKLRQDYQRLMNHTDATALRTDALALVVGNPGISETNKRKFSATITKETRLPRLQSYLTNFILAADGLAVI